LKSTRGLLTVKPAARRAFGKANRFLTRRLCRIPYIKLKRQAALRRVVLCRAVLSCAAPRADIHDFHRFESAVFWTK
jgi:hypothetical protein